MEYTPGISQSMVEFACPASLNNPIPKWLLLLLFLHVYSRCFVVMPCLLVVLVVIVCALPLFPQLLSSACSFFGMHILIVFPHRSVTAAWRPAWLLSRFGTCLKYRTDLLTQVVRWVPSSKSVWVEEHDQQYQNTLRSKEIYTDITACWQDAVFSAGSCLIAYFELRPVWVSWRLVHSSLKNEFKDRKAVLGGICTCGKIESEHLA